MFLECLQFSIVFQCFAALVVEIQPTGDEDPEDLGRKRIRGDPMFGGRGFKRMPLVIMVIEMFVTQY